MQSYESNQYSAYRTIHNTIRFCHIAGKDLHVTGNTFIGGGAEQHLKCWETPYGGDLKGNVTKCEVPKSDSILYSHLTQSMRY